MKKLKIWSIMMLMVMAMLQSVKAQKNFADIKGRVIFPIVNKYEGNTSIEFIVADAIDGNQYAPRIPHYYRAQEMWYFKDDTPSLIQAGDLGGDWFVSLNYISQTKGNGVTWNSGANTTQFVFHPGNHSSDKEVLYAFLWKYGDDVYHGKLYLVDVINSKVIALITSTFKGMDRASINVFAGMNCDADDMLVITDEDKTFLVFNQLPSETSGLNAIYRDIKNNETYTLSGRKLDKPKKGINIAKGKKFVVK